MNFSMKIFMTKIDEFKLQSQNLKRDAKPKKNQKEEEKEEEDVDIESD